MDEQASPNWRVTVGRRVRRWQSEIPWLVGGLVLGAWLGVSIGQGFRFVGAVIYGGIVESFLVLGAVVVLGLMAAGMRSWRPAIALAALVGSCSVGYAVAPEPVGAWHHASGTASMGTPTAPGSEWSGEVGCSWQLGDATVGQVGFSPKPLAPPGLVGPPKSDLERAYPARLSRLNLRSIPTSGRARLAWMHDTFINYKWEAEVDVLDLASNGQTGTVDVGVDGLVISWICEDGP